MKFLKKIETENDIHLVTERPNLVLINNTKRVLYNAPTVGVSIQHVDGKLYTTDEWLSNGFDKSEANGVAVLSSKSRFVIHKKQMSCVWSTSKSFTGEGVTQTTSSDIAKTDYAGEANTDAILTDEATVAAHRCANTLFPNGRKGYLPSMGELDLVHFYKYEIDNAMALIGGDKLNQSYWSSTMSSNSGAWVYIMNGYGENADAWSITYSYYYALVLSPLNITL